jgi:spermidine synthase
MFAVGKSLRSSPSPRARAFFGRLGRKRAGGLLWIRPSMIPWQLLDEAPVPGGADTLRLYQRGDEFSIRVGPHELMNSRAHDSEEQLAELACKALEGTRAPRVLIGGIGMGFTLAAALRSLGPQATVVMSELVPAVVTWNRGPLGAVADHPLRDERVEVIECDVGELMRKQVGRYHAILLDVDNGPEGLTRKDNDALYAEQGLAIARKALTQGGALWVWSAGERPGFSARLRRVGFTVQAHALAERGKRKGARYTLWEARVA